MPGLRQYGTPIAIVGDTSKTLERETIGGSEGRHNEEWLQRLLYRHPTCIPMNQIEPGLPELVPVCMELPLPSGYLDNLFMTPEGDIAIAEAKLFRNPQARREVVAQALDYAGSLFGMDYRKLEEAVLKSDFDGKAPPNRLYDLFSHAEALDEPEFVDAVNSNLKNGRIVVLVIGDGIRSDAEDLVDGLQSHAGFHFTFALVELAVFRAASAEDLLVVPRTLAKTCMIERGIVRIDDRRSEIIEVRTSPEPKTPGMVQSITSEQFYDVMRERNAALPDNLKTFIGKLESLGVYPDFKRSLIIRWDTPSGKSINLGYIMRNGQLWTDATVPTDGERSIFIEYLEDVAEQFGGEVVVKDTGNGYVTIGGKAPLIENVADRFDCWFGAIGHLQNRVREKIAYQERND